MHSLPQFAQCNLVNAMQLVLLEKDTNKVSLKRKSSLNALIELNV